MASVTSLGLHHPTGLTYLIQEHLLSPDPPPTAYTWQTFTSDEDGLTWDDELVTTKTCVVWSRGGIVRKSFRFEVEEEPVIKAILTSFPNDSPTVQVHKDRGKSRTHKPSVNPLHAERSLQEGSHHDHNSKALVIFLKTQAHIYFLSGSSHVTHLPFEVEYASAAPRGVIIQRKLQTNRSVVTSLVIPKVPPNSFISSQVQPWSAKSSQQSTFSIASLGSPKPLHLSPPALLGNMCQQPPKDDSNWPRLFSLTDPLAEMGLLVASQNATGNRRSSTKPFSLDPAEEILHITNSNELCFAQDGIPDTLVLVVTLNRQTSMYTVWRLTYVEQSDASPKKAARGGGTFSRRRSSFAPGASTGATTPVPIQHAYRESLVAGTTGPNKARRDEDLVEEKLDMATTLDPDYETGGLPRRKSRRVSSMLARADLSTSHERTAFSELAGHQNNSNKRGESFGGQRTRNSQGYRTSINGHVYPPDSHFGSSLNSFLEAPVDDLLEELRAGGDFEGFNYMGIDDEEFEGLRKEIMLTKIESIPVEHNNVRFSSQHIPVHSQYRTFALSAPSCASEDSQNGLIAVCILDSTEKKLVVISLNTTSHHSSEDLVFKREKKNVTKSKADFLVVTYGGLNRAGKVLDACKIMDGSISRILVLTETPNGLGELTLQAPWSILVKVTSPQNLMMHNIRSLGHDSVPQQKREGGFNRILSRRPRILRSLRNPLPSGRVDLVDDEGFLHQVQIRMVPQTPIVKQIIDVCRYTLPGPRGGEHVLVTWWNVVDWLGHDFDNQVEQEWTAMVVLLFAMFLGAQKPVKTSLPQRRHAPRRSFRSSGGSSVPNESWHEMLAKETALGGPQPPWIMNNGWSWLAEEPRAGLRPTRKALGLFKEETRTISNTERSLQSHIKLTQTFVDSTPGQAAFGSSGYMPMGRDRNVENNRRALVDIVTGLHLLREEQKLDISVVDSLNSELASLTPIVAQMCRWLGWRSWTAAYLVEDASTAGLEFDNTKILDTPNTLEPPSIYQWIEDGLTSRRVAKFLTIGDIVMNRSRVHVSEQNWHFLTPRTASFLRLFSVAKLDMTPIEMVEALFTSGFTTQMLETLPEAIHLPLREAIVKCQSGPPINWGKNLLSFADREDLNTFMFPGQQKGHLRSHILAPTHEANADVHTVCATNADQESMGSFDGSAEVDRQSITRLIFKEDRRFNEAAKILNTSKPTVARIVAEPEWSESDLLDAQKEHVQMLANRTLAIPSGRGLLYFSARTPLLTEKFPISGFNLHCVMKPSNNTVGVDKTSFTEEKVCWAFFHSGVAAGLSISRAAKGIDTSWILYNKPQELSNRHAGFLLALGLNGHLKSVAKWVAFKYLTPKHTMTSIGLLLGLAASYLGTMDSLITRLLSVHVTRMLPPGAAELNLSPLTQTTGIVGIGLLYCNTQHRRMSEIMLSEIEHVDSDTEEDSLRNEGYRLAAGIALGLINLGKGSDLKGLYDMHLTERLLALAVGSKKVNLVHILDKATTGAVVAIALIFMKSEDKVLARKINVPGSILQYDYVRPDTFLLRTMAYHLIMWSKIQASESWIELNLPLFYRDRSRLTNVDHLSSADLPFFDIITGLCFSIALRYAGSGHLAVRDLLVHYLDQMMRICRLPALNYDQKLTRNTTRNCQDLLALSVATVMAGTGDLVVFRRLRSMHGRDDSEIPYGSHLATHLAIGALFLGGGTYTFGTNNLAIAALIVAFYPIFPNSILDNKCHLQAFRHFWVLATEARCLVARDVETGRPVSVPFSLQLRDGIKSQSHAPCLLPELEQIVSISTNTREYWDVVVDFEKNPKHFEAFKSKQTIFVRRRPAYDASTDAFHATMRALDDTDAANRQPLEWIFDLPVFKMLTKAEQALVLRPENHGNVLHAGTEGTLVDSRLMLEKASLTSGKRDRLQGLKLLFEWSGKMQDEGVELQWIKREVIERLKAKVWMMSME